MKIFRFSVFLLFSSFALESCCDEPQPKKKHSARNDDSVKLEEKKAVLVEHSSTSQYNNFARFIAGLPQTSQTVYSKTEHDSLWIRHAARLNAKWKLMHERRNRNLIAWSSKELPQEVRGSDKLFYPFSGPDILNANMLFPKATSCYMIGLEPVGNLPDVLVNTAQHDSLRKYFNSLDASLAAITNYSFFRTKSMAVDFKAEELNGTIHLLILFLSRSNNTIANIRYVYIDEEGKQKDNADRSVTKNEGVEILYVDTAKQTHTVTYYSVNLDNGHLEKNSGMKTYINNLGHFNTYLKAASYLMHNASFSLIRGYILDQSEHVLQDDSGIPFRFFSDEKKWDLHLYGVYVPPIRLFANYYQKDMFEAYSDSTHVPVPLNFGIGYNFTKSNLILATKK